ncbi:TRAPP complex core subunit [Martiniozyma asiatica (nom. inval.)]|nr:TRAPP complex core subunit [Martiniozyma asiatica]
MSSTGVSKQAKLIGDEIWKNQTVKINGELFALTYGALVLQLCDEFAYDYERVNNKLEEMGYNIGVRIIEEFLCKSQISRCKDIKDTAEYISKVGFKMFLNITPTITGWSKDNREFTLQFIDNPLSEFVELPEDEIDQVEIIDELAIKRKDARKKLWYSNILVGVLKGALEMVQLDCEVSWISDALRGDESTLMRVKFVKVLKDEIPAGED